MEKVVYNELYAFCTKHHVLSLKNSGFKKGDGSVSQFLNITHSIYNGFNEAKETAMVYLDITKAFDKVWHKGLLQRLGKIGIQGPCLNWIESYLTERSQRVVLSVIISAEVATNTGVPQGSILGRLLFLIFINDIEMNIKSDLYLYADDVSLSKTNADPPVAERHLNEDHHTIENWAKRWLVEFNPSKTILLNFFKSILKLSI